MSKRILLSLFGAAGITLAAAAPASAGTAWSVSVAGPGYAIAAGRPVYVGAPYVVPHRHYWRRAYAAPVFVTAPPIVYRAPVVVRPAVVYAAPTVVYSAPVVVRRW